MRTLTFSLIALAVFGISAAHADPPPTEVIAAFNRVCTNTSAVAADATFEAALTRLRAEGEPTDTPDGWILAFPNSSIQLRATSGRAAPGPWICQAVMPNVRTRDAWRAWLRLNDNLGQAGNEVTFISHEGLSGVMIVERSEIPNLAVLMASPMTN